MVYTFYGIALILFIFLPASNLLSYFIRNFFRLLWLATVPATNGIVAQIFGTKNLTLLFGIVFLNHQFGSFLGLILEVIFTIIWKFDYAQMKVNSFIFHSYCLTFTNRRETYKKGASNNLKLYFESEDESNFNQNVNIKIF